MASIYAKVLGKDFYNLHPKLQKKYGLTSDGGKAIYCNGMMEEISGGNWFMHPIMKMGTKQNSLFPERGTQVPFTLEKYAYQSPDGLDCVSWIRKFHFRNVTRRFDTTNVNHPELGLVDYLGIKHANPVGISLQVTDSGGLLLRSTRQYFYIGKRRFSAPTELVGEGIVHENYDDDRQRFTVEVNVNNRFLGMIIKYIGHFQMEVVPITLNQIPHYAFPKTFDVNHRE